EQGYMAPVFGAYQPRLQGRWSMLQMMAYEQYGIPKEHNHYWYDKNGGFWDEPRWVVNEDGSLNPAAVLLRVYSEELYGTTFSKAYDFGSPGNKLLLGNLFTGPGKQVAAFMTAGDTAATLDLTLSSATSVKVVSPFGVEKTLPVVNGKLALPISELPTYVEFTGDLAVAPWNWGPNLATQTGVSAVASGSSVHPIDSSINNTITKVFNGQLENWYWNQNNDARLWESNASLPMTFELRLPSVQSMDRVVIYAGIPWQWDGSILDYELQADQGGQWVTLSRVQEPVNTFRAFTPTNRTTVDSFYSERCVFTHQFPPVSTQKLRLLVNEVTVGGASNQLLKDAGAQGGVRQLNLREIEVYRSGAVVSQNATPVAVPDSASTPRDRWVSVPVLANDSDSDKAPQPLTVSSVGVPANGRVMLSGGSLVYTPNAGFSGTDSFPYSITDGAASASSTVSISVSATPETIGAETRGLSGAYFQNADLTGSVFTRIDPWVDFQWGAGSPDPAIQADTYSVRWTGQVQPRFSEVYTFSTLSDDGVRLWVDGKLLIDRWNDHATVADQATIALTAGQKYQIKLEYYQASGGSQITLRWASPSQALEVIPSSALYAASASTPPPPPANVVPSAQQDTASTNESVAVLIPVLANDSDPDNGPQALSLKSVSAPAHGTAVVAPGAPGAILYTPTPGFYGLETFSYTVTDGAASASANVSVRVNSTAKALDLSSAGLTPLLLGGAGGSSRILADGSWELNGSGTGFGGTLDAVRIEGVSVSGDFRSVVKVQSLAAASDLARAGMVLRESGAVGAREVVLAVSPSNRNYSGARLVGGAAYAESALTGADAGGLMPNAWLMLERFGDTVRLSLSSDGVSYRPVATSTLAGLPPSVQVGLFASSGSSTEAARAVVSGWALKPAAAPIPSGQLGLLGVYHKGTTLASPQVARVDASLNFDWSGGAPHPSMDVDNFSVRWTGQVVPAFTETYTFTTQSDDGVRLWVNGQQLVNHWDEHATAEDSGTIALQAGKPYDVKLEYFEAGFGAVCKLLWSSPSQPKQIIPASALRPSVVPQTIGAGATASVIVLSDGSRELSALGKGLGGTSDQGGFLSQPCSGDFQIAIRVRTLSGGVPLGALMLREGFGAGDRFAALQIAADGSLQVVSRTAVGGVAAFSPVSGPLALPNSWLLVERRGDRLSLAVSADDINYRSVGAVTLPGLSPMVQVGAFLGSGSTTVGSRMGLGDYELTALVTPGLTGQYFGTSGLSGLRLTRTDGSVNFRWGQGSPDANVPVNGFSARWTGRVLPRFSENYTFAVQSDDGVRLWVNGRLIIDQWKDRSLSESTGTISLSAGKWYNLRLEYYENAGDAAASLLWSSPSQAKEVIPATRLSTP
ncbi:MAG: hypothetical protein RLZZ244_2487, partial [Verrucomicrobiota bacterium]